MDDEDLKLAIMQKLAFGEMNIKELMAELQVPNDHLKVILFYLKRRGFVRLPDENSSLIDAIRSRYPLTKEG